MAIMLNHIETFLEIAESGSISAAAKKLNYSASALTQAMNTLEMNVGFRLFNRTNQGVTLTEAGRLFQEEGRALLERFKRLLITCRETDNQLSSVKIGLIDNLFDAQLYSGEIVSFAIAHPEIEVETVFIEHDQAVDWLSARKIDACFCISERIAQLKELRFQPLKPIDIGVLMRPDNPLCAQATTQRDDLFGKTIVCNSDFFEDSANDYFSQNAGIDVVLEKGLNMNGVTRSITEGKIVILPAVMASPFDPLAYRPLNPPLAFPCGITFRSESSFALDMFVRWMSEHIPAQ